MEYASEKKFALKRGGGIGVVVGQNQPCSFACSLGR